MKTAYQQKMRRLWEDPAYRQKMLKALSEGRQVYLSNKRTVADSIYRLHRHRKVNAAAGGTQ